MGCTAQLRTVQPVLLCAWQQCRSADVRCVQPALYHPMTEF